MSDPFPTPCDQVEYNVMSLYYDAVTVLTGASQSGSLKCRIYGGASELKSKPAQVYALITECAKYDTFLKEVVDSAGLLAQEVKVCVSEPSLHLSAD